MSSNTCPICEETFSSPGGVRSHAWEEHGACHYCGARLDGSERETLYRHWLVAHPDDLSQVDRNRAENAVDSLSFTERLGEGGVGAAVGGLSRRTVVVAGGLVAIGGLAAGGILLGDELGGGNGITTADPGPVGTAPVPDSPGDYRYAVMGSADAAATVTYFGSWKCPVCAKFGETFLPTLVSDYVVPGDVRIEFRDLAYAGGRPFLGQDAPNAGHAGLAVWNTDPASYWRYHEVVFRNQPPESRQWATASKLAAFAEAAGVSDPGAVRRAVNNDEYESALRATTAAANDLGVTGTPTLAVGGTTVSPSDRERTRRLIEDAVANA